MDIDVLLTFLKVDLGINGEVYNANLIADIEAAQEAIAEEGIELVDDAALDMDLVRMYAGWLWRKRRTGEGMPRMLRYMLNNHLMSQKGKVY